MHNPFDRPNAIFASIIVAIVGWVVFMGMPVLVGALVETRGLSEAQAGYMASADLLGIFCASITISLCIRRIDRRHWVLGGILLSAACNILSGYVPDFGLLFVIRVIAGFGSGVCYSIALANLATTSNASRNFTYLIFALVATNALELYGLPEVVRAWGVQGIFIVFAGTNILCLAVLGMVPRRLPDGMVGGGEVDLRHSTAAVRLHGGMALLAIALFYITVSGYWAYVERMGVAAQLSDRFVQISLSSTTMLSLVGCLVAYQASKVRAQSVLLLWALGAVGASLLWIGAHVTATSFFGVLCIFQLLWNGIDIYQLGTLSTIDRSGGLPALVPAAQGLGQTLGPALSALTVSLGYGYTGVMALCASMAFGAALIYGIVFIRLRSELDAVPARAG
jgi:predicted MFS family arabinose efflux permease